MLKRTIIFVLSLSVLINLFVIGSFNTSFAADDVYSRNGEVYVMIGEGLRMGVYASQKIDATGKRVTINPDGVKMFGDPTKMNNYQAIAVDQFRNIYVLAGKYDAGLTSVQNVQPAGELYVPVDPPHGCGIAGVGRDINNKVFYDVLNFVSKDGGADIAHLHQKEPFWSETIKWSKRDRPFASDYHLTAGQYGGSYKANFIDMVSTPPATTKGFDFITKVTDTFNTNYSAKYPTANAAKIKRMPEDVWFPGDYLAWNNIKLTGNHEGMKFAKMWIHYDFQIQRISLWVSHYVEKIPAGTVLPAGMIAGTVKDIFENVFNTTNMKYKFMRHSGCESGHVGDTLATDSGITTEYKIGFTTTGAGRRYVYSSLPTPKIKRGTIQLVAGNTFGIPQVDSADYPGLDPSQALLPQTCSIGAATKNAAEDYVYTAPVTYGGWDVIDFTVADQWDGTGGVRYLLLQAAGAANKQFDLGKTKKLKWNKMTAYTPVTGDPVKDGEIPVPNDVKAIAGDGSGSVYYLTDPRAVFDNASGSDTFWSKDSTVTDLKPLTTPGKPEGPTLQDGKNVWMWYRKFSARAATELFQIEYYTKTQTKLNDFTVGNENAIVLETFSDANGTILVSRGKPEPIPPLVNNIKIDLATINLAGPPSGNDERMCVDIVSSATTATQNIKLKDLTYSTTTAGGITESVTPGDEVAEDTQYRCYMENTPLKFSDDLVKKNIISGLVLKDENNNGIKGGFDYSVRPATACYYWRVEMVEPMKKAVVPDTNFTSTTAPARNITLGKMTAAPTSWNALGGKGAKSNSVNFADGSWYSYTPRAWNADKTPGLEDAFKSDSPSDFAFTPKEPGIYKISLIASAKKWDYSKLGYPSYISDREVAPGCKDATTHYLFFDNGAGGGTAGNGIKDGGEDYVSERYVVVTAKMPVPDKYITNIAITGPQIVDENSVNIWTATADLKFIRSFNHENPGALMETFNGIGVWDYPKTVLADWGLPAFNGEGEDYAKGAPAEPTNAKLANGTLETETKARNFGEVPPGGIVIGAAAGGASIYGTNNTTALWIAGVGTTSDPTKALNLADRGCIEYEWYIAAQDCNTGEVSAKYRCGTTIDATVTNSSDPKRVPDILIAKGRLSDITPFAGTNTNAVTWSKIQDANRKFTATLNLQYAFDMPLAPGKYFLYIKFKYPKLKWEGRSPKKDNAGTLVKDAAGNQIYAYYDLVKDGDFGQTMYVSDNWAAINATAAEPAGYQITVNDKQAPQAYFMGNADPANNPKPADALADGKAPAAGIKFTGGTTGDPYPEDINYIVCDNNPNTSLNGASKLKALLGKNSLSLAFKDLPTDTVSDSEMAFDRATVEKALLRTITPAPQAKLPGQVQSVNPATTGPDSINQYPGYGQSAPYRQAAFLVNAPDAGQNADRGDLGSNDIPYDMVGRLPMFATGKDASGNIIGDADNNGNTGEVNVASTKKTLDVNGSPNELEYSNAPAYITVEDNDAPTVTFTALRSRDNIYRKYAITATGANVSGTSGHKLHHASYNDVLDKDPANPGKLVFKTFGSANASVGDFNLDNSAAAIPNQSNPVFPDTPIADATKCKQFTPMTMDPDIAVGLVNAQPAYIIKFDGKNVGLSPAYNDYSPVNVAYYNFDEIVKNTGGDTLELVEKSRTKLEITLSDNVDGDMSPAPCPPGATDMGTGNCYVDSRNLGDAETLSEIMNGWQTNGNLLTSYGQFRNPTPPENLAPATKPFFFIVARDGRKNTTAIKLPIVVLHTLMRTNVLNVETRRTE